MNSALLQRTIMFAVGIAAGLFLVFAATHAPARNYVQVICDDEPNQEQCEKIHFWYLSARSNERTSCCGVADAYWADKTSRVTKEGVFLEITDRRDCKYEGIEPKAQYEDDGEGGVAPVNPTNQPCIAGRVPRDGSTVFVPANVLDKRGQGNPTGHFVVFIGANNFLYQDGKEYPYIYCAFPDIGG